SCFLRTRASRTKFVPLHPLPQSFDFFFRSNASLVGFAYFLSRLFRYRSAPITFRNLLSSLLGVGFPNASFSQLLSRFGGVSPAFPAALSFAPNRHSLNSLRG